jgi:hypothetical protein
MKRTVAPAPHLRRVGLIITIASLIATAFATLMPEHSAAAQSHFCLVCGSFGAVDVVLNIILFVPLGLGLALSGARGKRAVIAMCALSALIETAQFFVIPGRDSTVGDVVTNTLGGALGFAIVRYSGLWLVPPPRIARKLVSAWAIIWLAIQIVSNFAFAPSLPESQYYGQIARTFGEFTVFPGRVLSASINGMRIPNNALDDSRALERMLLDGATVSAAVVLTERTHKIAPIVRVADDRQREILLLAEDGDDFIFGVRTGAAVLRVRPPLFALAGVFPPSLSGDSPAGDTLTLSGRYAASGVRIHVRGRSRTSDRLIPLTASLAWTLWLPFQWLIEGTWRERVLSWIWMGCLVIPFGYWAIRVRDSSRSQQARWLWAIGLLPGVALGLVGLILVPHALGLSGASVGDWAAALGGFAVGCGLSSRIDSLSATKALLENESER